MRVVKSDGSEWLVGRDGRERPYRFYHRWPERLRDWWRSRAWRRRQTEFRRTGTRYYGDGGTIHHGTALDIEVHRGRVVAVWFRCQALPFRVAGADDERAAEMQRLYAAFQTELHGVEVRDPVLDKV